jgi:purine-binding chemotaxis protein CheW
MATFPLPPPKAGALRPLLVFRLAGRDCALPLEAVQEVVPMARLSRPPTLPAVWQGFLNLGGAAVAVLHLSRLFGLPDVALGLYTPLLVLRQPAERVALLVEAVRGIVRVAAADVRPVRGAYSFNDCVEGEVSVGARRT